MNDASPERNRRILVIDDNRGIHDDFRKILDGTTAYSAALEQAEAVLFEEEARLQGSVSYEIDCAYQGQEGLALVQQALQAQRPYAMAFVDIRMPPGWDGVETIQKIWEVDPDLQVVICTAYSDYSWDEMIEKIGHSDRLLILKKPFDAVEAAQLAHTLTEKWSLLQQTKCILETLEHQVRERTSNLTAEIAKRARTEEELRESEQKYRDLFEGSRDAIITLEPPAWRFASVNPATVKMFGARNEEELVFLGPWELSPERQPDGRVSAEKAMEMNEIAVREGSHFFEWTHRRIGGEEFPADVLLAKIERDGRVILKATVRDITERKRTEEVKQQMAAIVESSEDAIIGKTLEGIITSWNPGAEKLFGYSAQEALGQAMVMLIPPERVSEEHNILERIRRGESVDHFDTIRVRKDGKQFDVSVTISPIRDGNGKVVGASKIARDITERKRAEDEIRTLARFPSENPNPVLRLGSDGTLLYANKASQPILNQWGCAIGDCVPTFWRELAVDAFASQREITLDTECGERFFTFTVVPVVDVGYVNLYGRDITERKGAEEALRESEARYRALIEATDTGFVVVDQQNRVVDANAEYVRLTGHRDLNQVRGRSVLEWTAAYEKERNAEAVERCSREGRIRNLEIDYVDSSGNITPIEINATVVQTGGTPLIFTLCRDITKRKRAEVALRESEARFRSYIEHAPQAVFVADEQSHFVDFNPAALELLGYDAATLAGMRIADIHAAEDQEALRQDLAKLLAEGRLEGEKRLKKRDGQLIWVLLRAATLGGGRSMAYCQDITDRKNTEKEMRWKSAFFKAVVHSSLDGILVVDEQGRKVVQNQQFNNLLKIPRRIAEQDDDTEQFKYMVNSTKHPEQFRDKVLYLYSHPDVCSRDEIEFKDGTVLDRCSSPVLGKDGKYYGRVWAFRDITERKRAEAALRDSEKRFRSLAVATSQVIWSTDGHGQVCGPLRSWQAYTGQSDEEIQGSGWSKALHPEDVEPAVRIWNRAVETKTGYETEYRVRRHDGVYCHFAVRGAPVVADDGSIREWIGTCTDITEHKQEEQKRVALEVQLRHAQKLEAIGQLAAGIAHEINTPTQYISDNTRFVQEAFGEVKPALEQCHRLLEAVKQNAVTEQMVREVEEAMQTADPEYLLTEVPKAVQQSLDGLRRVAKIVQAMKDFSHPGSESKTAVDLNRAIESTITVARNEWKYVSDLVTEFDPELPPVPCLPNEFNQVILNMLVNAAHAIADVVGHGEKGKGKITVSTRRMGDWVEVRISDTGTGIPEAVRPKVFEPFFTTKPVGKGSGQGLAIARSVVVDKHGGNIDFETEVGKGTTFIIRLPLGAEASATKTPVLREEPA